MNKFVVIVAGGKGTRMGSNTPKQFLTLNGKPILFYSIEAFMSAFEDIQIIIVLPDDYFDFAKSLIESTFTSNIQYIIGGETRYNSVKNGLSLIKNEGIVFVHDGARPFVTKELIIRCYTRTLETRNAIPAIPITDSVRLLNAENSEPINRDRLRIIQTPQTFNAQLILSAFSSNYKAEFTDEATVLEASGIKVNLIEGDIQNIKITTPHDLLIAESILKLKTTMPKINN